MGGGGSQTINQSFNMSAINKSIYEQVTKNKASAAASGAVVQNLEVVMRNVRGCSSSFGQKVDSTVTATSTLMAEVQTEIKNAITNEMQASVQAQIEKATQAGNFQFGDKQNVNQEVTMEIENIIENSIETVNENESKAESVVVQGGRLIIDGYDCREGGDINWNQDVHAQVLATALTSTLSKSISDSVVLNKLSAAASGSAKTENKGIADIFGALFAGMFGPGIASSVCICLIILLPVIMGAIKPKGGGGGNYGGGNY
jgi:hypothetical protein